MLKVDYHVHTGYCPHACGTIEEYIENAIKNGVSELGFCDHLPLIADFQDDYTMQDEELSKYVDEIVALRNSYKNVSNKIRNTDRIYRLYYSFS